MLYSDFIDKVDDNLRSREFKIWRDVPISDEREVSIFATEIKYSIVRVPIHLFVAYSKNPTPEEFMAYFEQCLAYSKRAYTRGFKQFLSTIEVIPCLVSETADQAMTDWLKKRHYYWRVMFKHIHGTDFYPVLFCLDSESAHYWKGWTYIGSAIWLWQARHSRNHRNIFPFSKVTSKASAS